MRVTIHTPSLLFSEEQTQEHCCSQGPSATSVEGYD